MRNFMTNMHEALANLSKFSTYYVTLGAVFSGFVLLGVLVYWLVYPYHILDQREFYVTPYNTVPGDRLQYHFTYEKYQDMPETSTLVYVCETNRIESPIKNTRSWIALGISEVKSYLAVPNKTEPELCYLEAEVRYKPNPIREVVILLKSDPFYIGTPSATVKEQSDAIME